MADPVVSLALYAETRGYYHLDEYDGSPQSRIAAYWCMNEAKKDIDARLAESDAQRLYAEMAVAKINVSEARDLSKDAYKKLRGVLKPWIMEDILSGSQDPLDSIVLWYIINAPDKLEALGVELGRSK